MTEKLDRAREIFARLAANEKAARESLEIELGKSIDGHLYGLVPSCIFDDEWYRDLFAKPPR